MAKHVIFLGAGASNASGYPLANGLRLMMCSKSHFHTYFREHLDSDDHTKFLLKWSPMIDRVFEYLQNPVTLFREGGSPLSMSFVASGPVMDWRTILI